MAENETYEHFVNKFNPKKTTDDCYTPGPVYDYIADWVSDKFNLSQDDFIRPFYPGGGYLVSDQIAAKLQVAKLQVAKLQAAKLEHAWNLSDREKKIIKSLR